MPIFPKSKEVSVQRGVSDDIFEKDISPSKLFSNGFDFVEDDFIYLCCQLPDGNHVVRIEAKAFGLIEEKRDSSEKEANHLVKVVQVKSKFHPMEIFNGSEFSPYPNSSRCLCRQQEGRTEFAIPLLDGSKVLVVSYKTERFK